MEITVQLKNQLVKRYVTSSFYNFFKYFWSKVEANEYTDNWHIKKVCDELEFRYLFYMQQKVSQEGLPDLLFNLPPGCSKSLMISVFFPA